MVDVIDQRTFAEVVRSVIDEAPGSWRELTESLGIGQTTLSRIARLAEQGELSRIRETTAARLLAHLEARDQQSRVEQLRESILPPAGVEHLAVHQLWIESQFRRYLERGGTFYQTDVQTSDNGADYVIRLIAIDHDPARRVSSPDDDMGEAGDGGLEVAPETVECPELGITLSGIPARRFELYASVMEALAAQPAIAAEFERFADWCVQNGHDPGDGNGLTRAQLAVFRTIEPLLDPAESAFIERTIGEMTQSEILEFVRCGLARERILLKREPDLQRAQSLVDRTAYGAW